MKAIKGNREYDVKDESTQDYFQKKGFDIVDGDGTIVKYGRGKTVPYEEYARVLSELELLKGGEEKNSIQLPPELYEMSNDELKAYAESNGYDIGNASTAEGILKKIKAAIKE